MKEQNTVVADGKDDSGLVGKWKFFFGILLDPWTLILLSAIIFLHVYGYNTNDSTLALIFNVIITALGTTMCTIAFLKWERTYSHSIVKVKGESAIRSLQSLILTISRLEKRIFLVIDRINPSNSEYAIIKSNYEEFLDSCAGLKEMSFDAIENWTDIIPDAGAIRSKIQEFYMLQGQILSEKKEKDRLREQFEEIRHQAELSEDEKDALKLRLNEKDKSIARLTTDLQHLTEKLNKSIFSGMSAMPPTGSIPSTGILAGAEIGRKTSPQTHSHALDEREAASEKTD